MIEIKNLVEGDIKVNEDTKISGMLNGNAFVSSNKRLDVNGILNGDVYISPSAQVYIYGIVDGVIENRGGHLEVFGVVKKFILDKKGETEIHTNAIVSGKKY
ncbi:hypothetical protein [Propionispira raffinosivorans]|uniref:hypothetical protein n=1 Tax=Propionispira raffinosivorans TaxID=86959 RepID=UPI00037B84AD|nr:hypothetical protein [Propionispira raffinosivorans]